MKLSNGQKEQEPPTGYILAQAVFVVNKHAKTASEPKALYELKKHALNKLLSEGRAKKLGLHFSDNPRFSAQQSDVIIECSGYIFHLPPTRDDLKTLPHLGKRSPSVRNPKASLSLSRAKSLLHAYIGTGKDKADPRSKTDSSRRPARRKTYDNPFPSSFLGKGFKWH